MPLDRPNRTRAADALAAYLRGEIDNYALDDEIFAQATDGDSSSRLVRHWIWCAYDDTRRHAVSVSPDGWHFLRRCLAFLRADLESPHQKKLTGQDVEYAPFSSPAEWSAHRHLIDAERLPPYDPAIHARPYRGWNPLHMTVRWRGVAAFLAVASAAFCVLRR